MNREREKQIYEKIANITDEEKAAQILSKIKRHKPFKIREALHRFKIHSFPFHTVASDVHTNSVVRKCDYCGELFRQRMNLDRGSYIQAGLIATLFVIGSILVCIEFPFQLLSILCFLSASYWSLKVFVESQTT